MLMTCRAVAATVFCLVSTPTWAQSHYRFFEPVQPPRTVQVMVHRGLRQLAPENSRHAVLACASDYCEWAEIDVRLTKDGAHVVIHHDAVDATTDGHGPVAELTLEQLQQLDSGAWFAARYRGARLSSLREMLAAAKGKVNLYLDCKRIDPELLVREVQETAMESQVVVYDRPEMLARIRAAAGKSIATMAKFRPETMAIDTFVAMVDPAGVEIDADAVTPELCRAFHDRGIKVQAKVLGENWDNPATWNSMLDAGVDWLQTDDPAGVRFSEVRRRVPQFPVQIACHRGASRYAPENTLPAIRTAVELGADYIEIDIRTTRDGQCMLLHDRTLNRTTNGAGNIGDQTADAVLRLDAGSWFGKPFVKTPAPRLEDALIAFGGKSAAYLDAKDIAPEQLLAAIRAHRFMDRHVVYQSPEYCRALKALDSSVRVLPPLKTPAALDALVEELHPYGVDASWTILSAEMIGRCHAANVRVFSDALGLFETVDSYRQAIAWGIDVIQTDHPLRVLRAIELESGR